ncbi:hypothetical protein AB3X52_04425 [Nocardioides sp. DS6]|uniref:Prenyltransferase n=1 Tax=Nocardioides eburneus TaxID=3231482 RepID=A0ABV3SXV3_9ACTN
MSKSRPWQRKAAGARTEDAADPAAEAAEGTPAATSDEVRPDPAPADGAADRSSTAVEAAAQPAATQAAPAAPAGPAGPAGTIFDDETAGDGSDDDRSTAGAAGDRTPAAGAVRRHRARDWTPFLLVRAAHPRQAVLTAVGITVAAALAGRPSRELALIFATVLVGQCILGWHNDLVDEPVDLAHERTGKPISDGRLDPGTAWFTLCCGVLLVVPLAVSNGVVAGLCYLASVVVGMIGNVVLRRGLLSFVPWAVSFALYPAFLSYGGWGGSAHGPAPEIVMVVLSALLGVGVHVLLALWGLVADNDDGWTYLPLKLGLRMGAGRLLTLSLIYALVVTAALLYAGHEVGLSQ